MSIPSRGSTWAIILLGILSVGLLGFGTYSVMHTGNNVKIHEGIIDRKKEEIARLQGSRNRLDVTRARELEQSLTTERFGLREYEDYHQTALLILGGGGVVFLAFLVCLWIRLRNRVASD